MADPSSSHGHDLTRFTTYDSTTYKSSATDRILDRTESDTSVSSNGSNNPFLDHGTDYEGLDHDHDQHNGDHTPTYRVYKRRFIGLVQLVLLNMMVSWDWLSFAAVSSTAAEFFRVNESTISWLSTAFLFAFAVSAPLTIWILNQHGPKVSILIASGLVLAGNWIRYAGCRAGSGYFWVVMLGQVLIGLSQPFVLAAPTRYSNLWFSDSGRVSATAVASLANPFGGAIGQLIGPLWVNGASDIPTMVLFTALISSAAALPAPFIPSRPRTPPSATAASETLDVRESLRLLPKNGSFFLTLIPFSLYVGLFNSTSSLLNQILSPYGFSETDAGIAGGILIIVGLIASAILSPIIDRTKAYLVALKILVPCIAGCYTALIFMPGLRDIIGPYVVCGLLGAFSFSLLPMALELLSIVTLPVSPEVSSVIAWTGGQTLGAVFIIVMSNLPAADGEPSGNMTYGLIFQAAVAWFAVPFPMFLGLWKFKKIHVP